MTSIKVKFRPSTVESKEGSIYFQIIRNRIVCQLNTDYKTFAYEWDAETESIVVNDSRSAILCSIKERLEWGFVLLEKAARQLETERCRYTADDMTATFRK